jgi:hypothetical protein
MGRGGWEGMEGEKKTWWDLVLEFSIARATYSGARIAVVDAAVLCLSF